MRKQNPDLQLLGVGLTVHPAAYLAVQCGGAPRRAESRVCSPAPHVVLHGVHAETFQVHPDML